MDLPKRRILMNALLKSQFSCSVTGVFIAVHWITRLIKLHERCLRIAYNDKKSNFEELLIKDNSISIHHRNIQTIATEMYKFANRMSPEITNEIFQLREINHYNLSETSIAIYCTFRELYLSWN